MLFKNKPEAFILSNKKVENCTDCSMFIPPQNQNFSESHSGKGGRGGEGGGRIMITWMINMMSTWMVFKKW